jgi:uncharacterized coiled-coil protein SlyX
MPDNPSPAAQPDPVAEPIEFNFDKPGSEVSRLKRRSLKGKTPGLKPANAPAAARELEREAPPLTADEAARPAAPVPDTKETSKIQAEPPRSTPVAPPRTTPAASATAPAAIKEEPAQRPASTASIPTPTATNATAPAQKTSPAPAATSGASGQKVNIALTSQHKATVATVAVLAASDAKSPHGTRPATLYYTSQPKKEALNSMKPTTSASPASTATTSSTSAASASRPVSNASSASAASAARPVNNTGATASSATRPAASAATSATRPAATNFDYRSNVERQSREQKSVGSILAYFVYGLVAVFIIGASLAGYGAYTINQQLHDQSTSLSSLDSKYDGKVAALNKELAATQDTLAQAQAQISREQDVINKEQEQLNQLVTQLNDNAAALKSERSARQSEAASLRARIRDLEYKTSVQNLSHP